MSKWKTLKVRDFAHTTSGGTPSTTRKDFWENGTIPWINSGELSQYDFIQKPTTFITEKGLKYSSAKLFPKKTVGIALTGATTGMVAHLDIETTTNQSIVGIFPNETLDSLYLFYYLKNNRPYILSFNVGSAQEHINKRIVDSLDISFPEDVKEQSKIAQILFTIDRAIAQTEALIAKRQRIKTGLMQDLLTRGIDEHGQLRDPSTHRFKSTPLGMIPEEWEVSNIGKISHRVTSGSRWWARYYSDTGAKFIRIGNLTREHVNLRLQNIQHVQPPDSSEAKRTVLETGDLLISVTADLGIIGIVPSDLGEAYINQHIALVKFDKEKINPYFIGNLLSGFQSQKYFSLLNDSGAKAGLNLKAISAFPVVFPSDKKEQDRIAEIIQKTDGIIETQKSERKKLLGVKAGLMQDLLSGRVSVKSLMEG